jgi:serine-type D-Ala-D-Ala carboxypeptidase
VVLLTNRVHAARARQPAKVIADVRADLTDAAAIAVTDDPSQTIAMPASFRSDAAKGWNRREHHGRARRNAHHGRVSAHTKTSASRTKSVSSKSKARGSSHAAASKTSSHRKKAS